MALIKNKPCELGAQLGENMARFADVAEAEWREAKLPIPVRCQSCAFKKGTFPNRCLATQGDATKSILEGVPFYCHHGKGCHGPEALCGGWLLLAGAGDKKCEMPWPWLGVEK